MKVGQRVLLFRSYSDAKQLFSNGLIICWIVLLRWLCVKCVALSFQQLFFFFKGLVVLVVLVCLISKMVLSSYLWAKNASCSSALQLRWNTSDVLTSFPEHSLHETHPWRPEGRNSPLHSGFYSWECFHVSTEKLIFDVEHTLETVSKQSDDLE